MPRKRRKDKPAPTPHPVPPDAMMPEDEVPDEVAYELLSSMVKAQPELLTEMRESWEEWRAAFLAEHGREPSQEEFVESMLDVWEDDGVLDTLQVALDGLLEEALDGTDEAASPSGTVRHALGFERDPSEWGIDDETDPELISGYCAWCGDPIAESDGGFSFGATLRFRPVHDRQSTVVFYLPLISYARLLPALLTSNQSPALEDGWDLVVCTCGEPCARLAREALRNDNELAERLLLN
jgi:hypothetical protein